MITHMCEIFCAIMDEIACNIANLYAFIEGMQMPAEHAKISALKFL